MYSLYIIYIYIHRTYLYKNMSPRMVLIMLCLVHVNFVSSFQFQGFNFVPKPMISNDKAPILPTDFHQESPGCAKSHYLLPDAWRMPPEMTVICRKRNRTKKHPRTPWLSWVEVWWSVIIIVVWKLFFFLHCVVWVINPWIPWEFVSSKRVLQGWSLKAFLHD